MASTLINGLQLVKSVSRALNDGQGTRSPIDSAYSGAMNTAALLTALTSQASQGVQSRSSSFQSIGSQVGSGRDVKASIDQNTQMQVQTGQTINELVGVSNGAVAALNMENVQRLTRQSQTAKFLATSRAGPTRLARLGDPMPARLFLAAAVALALSSCGHRDLTAPCGPLGVASSWLLSGLLATDPCGPLRPVNPGTWTDGRWQPSHLRLHADDR